VGWTQADEDLRQLVPTGAVLLIAGNKADLSAAASPDLPCDAMGFSALSGEGVQPLVQALLQRCGATDTRGLQVALNERQADLAAAAAASLGRALEAAQHQLPWDFWTIDLRAAVRCLGEITGEEVSEAVLDRVFSRFCIGK